MVERNDGSIIEPVDKGTIHEEVESGLVSTEPSIPLNPIPRIFSRTVLPHGLDDPRVREDVERAIRTIEQRRS